MTKVDSFSMRTHIPNDVESIASNSADVFRDGFDDDIGIDSEQIVSLYLQRNEGAKSGETFREYLQNHESVRAIRRRQLFKRKDAVDEGREVIDYSMYQKRRCVTAIPKKPGSDLCGCNELLTNSTHDRPKTLLFGEEASPLQWDYKSHTKLEKTDAFGRVKFSSIQKAKYIRLDVDTDSQELSDLVQNVFNLSTPGVIISVKGSLLGFSVTSKIEKIIQRGLLKAAITTNGWITTSGIDAGYVISVGEALKMHNNTVPCIGFSSWGCLPELVRQALTVKDGASLEKGEHICTYPKVKVKPGSSVENLEANHSHHILSDTGAKSDWGSESSLRARWEGYMRDVLNIPVVMVVMQGSIGAAEFLCKGLRSGTPAVVVYGSGGVCDVIVNLVRHTKELSKKTDRRSLIKQNSFNRSSAEEATTEICNCSSMLSLDCPVVNQFIDDGDFLSITRKSQEFLDDIFEIVTTHQQLLILFDVEDDYYDGLDAALLEALVKAQNVKDTKNNNIEDLCEKKTMNLSGVQVALGWNRPDFAERLLKADTCAKDDIALGSILIHALAWNLHEFTHMLLSHDASIPMVAANTVVLYNSSHNTEHLKRYVRYNMRNTTGEIKFDKDTVDQMINQLLGKRNKFNSNVSNESDPYFELMLWGALSLFPEVAELMWKSTQEPIRAALVVVVALKRLSKANKVIINANEKNVLRQITNRFEELATKILDNLNQVDKTVCERALNSRWVRLHNNSYIDMAFRCKARDFLAHPACQEISERRWKRGLTAEVNLAAVFAITLCPLLLLTNLITFRKEYSASNPFSRFFKRCKAYLSSPSVKFWFSVECYIAFLVYSTYIILIEFGITQHAISSKKIIYFAWFGLLMLDEAIEVVSTGHFKDWARSSWNWIDAIMYLFNLIGIILVHIPYSKEHPDYNSGKPQYQESYYNAGRIFLSMSLIFFYIRLLHMFTIDSTLGPTILMIQKMMHDFKVFLLMFLIVAVAFGVGYAVALTDPENFQQHRLNFTSGIFFYTAFQMYGELFVEDLGSGQSRFEPSNTSTERIGFVIGLVGVYMAIVLLMMVNLLIAMFSDTYTRIKDREDVIFKYQKLELLLDVEHKFLSPPFSLFHFVIYCVTKYCRRDRRRYSKEKNDCSDNKWKDTVIRSAVVDSLEDYLKRERNLKGSETEALVQESTKMLKNKMFKLQRYVENIQSSIDVLSQLPANN